MKTTIWFKTYGFVHELCGGPKGGGESLHHPYQREDAFQKAEHANRRCGEYATQTRERGPLLPAVLVHGVHDVLQTNGLHGRDPLTI